MVLSGRTKDVDTITVEALVKTGVSYNKEAARRN
jgi:hypothetical protein